MKNPVLPWSYSSLQQYETCPRRFKITRIDKAIKEPMTQATLWGNEVHKALELAVKGTNALQPKFQIYQPIVAQIRETPGHVETERNFAITKSFTPTGYWEPDAWVRGKIDVSITRTKSGIVIDYKTGKVKDDIDQLNLGAVALLIEKPFLERVHSRFMWLAGGKTTPATVERSAIPIILGDFAGRVQRMENSAASKDWPPRPSGLCKKYCPVGKSLCEFCGT